MLMWDGSVHMGRIADIYSTIAWLRVYTHLARVQVVAMLV